MSLNEAFSHAYHKRDDILLLDFPFKIVSKSNYRKGKSDWSKYKAFEKEVGYYLLSINEEINHFRMINKKSKFVISIIGWGRYDAGNISKSILDSLESYIYDNDRDVISVLSTNFTAKKERFIVAISRVESDEYGLIKDKIQLLNNYISEKI